MKVSLSVGSYATHPFCLEGLGLRVYCAEELCYCLRENAFLLDTDLMTERLVKWLREECELEDLADELSTMVHKKGSLSAFVLRILEYVGFYELDVMREVERTLKNGAGLSILEKRKLRIDQLLGMQKFAAAVSEYDALLDVWEEANHQGQMPGANLKSKLLHNRGVALAGLMRYDRAAESFHLAYETDGSRESLRAFLAARRLELKNEDYVAFLSGAPECTELAMQLEKEVEQANRSWTKEADYQRLSSRGRFREEDERGYREETEQLLQALKAGYRSMWK